MEVTQLQEEGRVLAGHLTEAQVELLLQALAVSPAPVSFVLVFVLGVCFRMCARMPYTRMLCNPPFY